MKHELSYTLGSSSVLAAAAACLMLTAGMPAVAETVANGPYYATPSWDQTLPSNTRFIVLSNMNNAAVLDRETGLVWQRTVGTASDTFSGAVQRCALATTGNRKGWRLPSFHELHSLLDPSVTIPGPNVIVAFPAGHPFINGNLPNDAFWTGTTIAQFPEAAYFTGLSAGAGLGQDFKTSSHRFWCVRGGGPISVY